MIDPPTPLGPNPIGDTSFFAFYEKQNVALDRDVKLGKMKTRNAQGRKVRQQVRLEEGTLVSSHYVLYDPADLVKQSVTIEFDSEILGVVVKGGKLRKTDFLGADGVEYLPRAERQIREYTRQGLGSLPICIAKTPLSLSDNPNLKGRPAGFRLTIREVRAYTGAGFLCPIAGNIMTMPGLSSTAAVHQIDIDDRGEIVGLF